MSTCERYSCTVLDRPCWQRIVRCEPVDHWTDCVSGRSSANASAGTTRRRSLWRIELLESSGRPGNLNGRLTATGAQKRTNRCTTPLPTRCARKITIMFSGSVRGAVKPITIVAIKSLRTVWLRVGESHDVQSSLNTAAHQQTNTRLQPTRCSSINILSTRYLTEESIPDC